MIAGSEVAYPTVASFATSAFKEFCRLGEVSNNEIEDVLR